MKVMGSKKQKATFIKGVLAFFLDKYTMLSRTEISAYLGYASPGGLSNILSRIDQSYL